MAKKKRGHEEGHENAERWLLTYADMITLLMLFFIVLWSMSQVDQSKYEKVSQSLEAILAGGDFGILNWNGGKPSPGVLASAPKETGRPDTSRAGTGKSATGGTSAMMSRAVSTLQSLIREGKVRVTMDERGAAISIAADVGFGANSADLDPEGLRVVGQVADFLRQLPNRIMIEGHSDSTPPDPARFTSAWELSALRALSVLSFLETYGVQADRMSATSYGSTRPLRPNDTPEGRAYNRRVEIIVVNDAGA
jgi:chemotaxis protein MotB